VSATANNSTNLTSQASGAATSLVAAGARGSGKTPDGLRHPAGYDRLALDVDTTAGAINNDHDASVHRKALAAGTDHEGGSSSLTQSSPWNSDVTILASTLGNPTLIIGQDGTVKTQNGIGFTNDGTTITVADITGSSTGQVLMNSIPYASNDSGFGNTDANSGSRATWKFVDTLCAVSIINSSPENLLINNISVVSQGTASGHDVTLLASDKTASSIGLTFAIDHVSEPTLVTIKNQGDATPGVPGSS
jgi:hypothetical protein